MALTDVERKRKQRERARAVDEGKRGAAITAAERHEVGSLRAERIDRAAEYAGKWFDGELGPRWGV